MHPPGALQQARASGTVDCSSSKENYTSVDLSPGGALTDADTGLFLSLGDLHATCDEILASYCLDPDGPLVTGVRAEPPPAAFFQPARSLPHGLSSYYSTVHGMCAHAGPQSVRATVRFYGIPLDAPDPACPCATCAVANIRAEPAFAASTSTSAWLPGEAREVGIEGLFPCGCGDTRYAIDATCKQTDFTYTAGAPLKSGMALELEYLLATIRSHNTNVILL